MDDEADTAGGQEAPAPDRSGERRRIERRVLTRLFPHLDPEVVAEVLELTVDAEEPEAGRDE